MREKKQSFLERLTGTRVISNEEGRGARAGGNVLSEKPWSPRLDNAKPQGVANMYTKYPPDNHAEEGRSEPEPDEEDEDDPKPKDAPDDEEEDSASLAIDMYESDNELIVQCMIAGVMPEDLHVAITRERVTISGERVAPEGIPEDQYIAQELYWGSFSRDITLPFEIDTEGAEAVEKYGLLVIRLPKLNTGKTQELKVKSVE
ncbi:MAG: Hsp20/alpha crystallin family protein [bacterium]|nr:Hsp20/alpha crystallin family protein [bacterium]